ncbi:MAG: phosphatase PAP2 family protein [Bacteroidetes bacterium]|nr:phosphatase PAP2 family protein [Bacteroidota bacterium]
MNFPRLKDLFKKNIFFLLPYFIFLIAGAILVFLSNKDKLHLYFNSYHNELANGAFYYLTFLGDGWTALCIAIALLFIRYRYSVIIVLSYLLSSATVQILKRFIFNDHIRPALFFKNNPDLYLVPGVDNNIFHSFPSGHSTTAFAVYFGLALFIPNKWLKFCLFILALLIALSRVYLSQHFFEDIYAGSVIGVASTLIIYSLLNQSKQEKGLDKSLI